MNPAFLGSVLFGLLLTACGGSVDTPPGSGGAGGAGGTGGAGGATSSTSGGGGGTPVACGARSGGSCGAEEYCDFPDDSCATFDTVGQCADRPEVCPADCPGVCGCDGQFYCNACTAQMAGVDVSESTSCLKAEGADYAASYWPGGLDHVIVYKADKAADRCVMLYADATHDDAPEGFDVELPDTWVVSRVALAKGAADCAPGTMSPAGEAVNATGATGTLSWDIEAGSVAPCALDIDVTVTFPGEPAPEVLRAAGLDVAGGCL
ncbi:hypothetical protein [Sorangium cellulosum]|uniref:Kazal-like domain-containing protein n=1 Tax=Sorangium cellulosum TaxID=56 RepID=A0A150QIW1_SORCE|nr:hypothetical protein [Sorangium cellulosum]KYF67890.1 hypothetical protein BE15_33070 [Sorangium cellulosum]